MESGTSYDLSVYGPNGFLRAFKGNVAAGAARATNLDVGASYDSEERGGITLRITNTGKRPLR